MGGTPLQPSAGAGSPPPHPPAPGGAGTAGAESAATALDATLSIPSRCPLYFELHRFNDGPARHTTRTNYKWINVLGLRAQAVREDRILDEVAFASWIPLLHPGTTVVLTTRLLRRSQHP